MSEQGTSTVAEVPEELPGEDQETEEAEGGPEAPGEEGESGGEEETSAPLEPDEDEPEASSPQGPTPEEVDKILGRIEKRGETYTRAVEELAAEAEQEIVRCPVCIPFVPGYVFNPEVQGLTEVQAKGAQILLGMDTGPMLRQAPDALRCPTCDGHGEVSTGSRVRGKGTIVCQECRGLGFIGEAANLTPAMVGGGEEIPLALVPDERAFEPEEDQWQTPKGSPDYGVMPQYRGDGWQERRDAFRRTLGLSEAS